MIIDSSTLMDELLIGPHANHGGSTLAEPPAASITSPLARSRRSVRSEFVGLNAGHGQIIGLSAERRSIYCLRRGRADAAMKLLILAGQHGDEQPAREAVESLLKRSPGEVAEHFSNLQMAVIFEANPDGHAARMRCNAEGVDLNRDHQLLQSRETTALHQFVRQWRPHVILDVHSYPSRRRHLLEQNVVLDHDVFIDVPNHPAILARPSSVSGSEVLQGLLRTLGSRAVRAGRYTIVEASGRARHSTPDVLDARNGLALRYGVFTLLVENRQPRRDESAGERRRLQTAQECALWTILDWLDQHHDLFPPWFAFEPPAPGAPVQVRFKYRNHHSGLSLTCRDANQGRPMSVVFRRYCGSLVPRRTVLLPGGYAVPMELEALRDVLKRHGFVSTEHRAGELCAVEKLRVEAARPSRRPGAARKPVVAPHRMSARLDSYEIFPTHQNGGEALAVFLEPESQHGLHRFAAMEIPLVAPSWYPVLRVLAGGAFSP